MASSSTCTSVDSILDRVQLHARDYLWDYYDVNQLKLELRLLRTFLLCARRWNNNHVNLSLVSSLSEVEYSIHEIVQQYYPVFLRSDDEICCDELSYASYDFLQKIQNIVKLEINELYSKLSSCFSSHVKDGLMELINSLIENLADFIVWGEVYYNSIFDTLIEPLQERLIFLKNLIGFVVLRGVEQNQLEHLLIHCEVVVVNAARISYTCWFFRDDENVVEQVQFDISKLLDNIKPVGTQIGETYIQVLNASSLSGSSRNLISEMDKHTLRDFVDSLLSYLWDELVSNGSSLMVFEKERMKIFLDGLRFLKTILKWQQEKFDGLDGETKNLTGFVVSEAGILVLTLSANKMNEGLSKEMDIAISELLEKISLIKVELTNKYPVASICMFPRTNELVFMNYLLENLKEVASSEVNAILFVKERLQTVLEHFVFLRSFLENIVERRHQHKKLQALWSRVIEVAYKTELVIDSLLVGGIPDPSPLLVNTIIEEIKVVKTEVFEINDNKCDFEFRKTAKNSSHVQSRGGIPKINDVVVGLDDEARIIIDQLSRRSIQLDIVSIVGMPGLGKTTLAKKVYNDPSIICHFHICAWCCVSQVYRMKDLLLEILYCIVPKASDQYSEMNENDLAEKLYRHLKGNRYLIVLDDMWDKGALDLLGRSFPNDANSSRILLTTRLHKLALEIKPNGNSHPLRRLTDDESYELLKKKLYGKEGYPLALNSLGMQIAKNCNGLPLSVVIISGILSTLDQDDWKEVEEKLSSKIVCSTEECKYILELSYEHLPDYLKSCLLYFGAFREDQEIPTWRLTWLWIAEGFVQKTEIKRLEDVAEDYLMDLIGRSLVMVAKQKSIGGVKLAAFMICYMSFVFQRQKKKIFYVHCVVMMSFVLLVSHTTYDSCAFTQRESILRSPDYSVPVFAVYYFLLMEKGMH